MPISRCYGARKGEISAVAAAARKERQRERENPSEAINLAGISELMNVIKIQPRSGALPRERERV